MDPGPHVRQNLSKIVQSLISPAKSITQSYMLIGQELWILWSVKVHVSTCQVTLTTLLALLCSTWWYQPSPTAALPYKYDYALFHIFSLPHDHMARQGLVNHKRTLSNSSWELYRKICAAVSKLIYIAFIWPPLFSFKSMHLRRLKDATTIVIKYADKLLMRIKF